MTNETLAILTNAEAILIDQDILTFRVLDFTQRIVLKLGSSRSKK